MHGSQTKLSSKTPPNSPIHPKIWIWAIGGACHRNHQLDYISLPRSNLKRRGPIKCSGDHGALVRLISVQQFSELTCWNCTKWTCCVTLHCLLHVDPGRAQSQFFPMQAELTLVQAAGQPDWIPRPQRWAAAARHAPTRARAVSARPAPSGWLELHWQPWTVSVRAGTAGVSPSCLMELSVPNSSAAVVVSSSGE